MILKKHHEFWNKFTVPLENYKVHFVFLLNYRMLSRMHEIFLTRTASMIDLAISSLGRCFSTVAVPLSPLPAALFNRASVSRELFCVESNPNA